MDCQVHQDQLVQEENLVQWDPLDQQDQVVHLVQQEIVALLVKLVHEVNLA